MGWFFVSLAGRSPFVSLAMQKIHIQGFGNSSEDATKFTDSWKIKASS